MTRSTRHQLMRPTIEGLGHALDRPASWPLGLLVALLLLQQVACATRAPQATERTEASTHTVSVEPRKDEHNPPSDDRLRNEPPEDEENLWGNRILAAPEYAWAGFTYPFKKLAIAYEQHDLMNRALDVFLNDERTAGVFPKFAIGGALSSGIGFTAFDNNLFRQGKEARLSYILATRNNQAGELSYRDPSLFGSRWFLESNTFLLDFDKSHFFPGGNQAREQDKTNSN